LFGKFIFILLTQIDKHYILLLISQAQGWLEEKESRGVTFHAL